MFPRDSSGRSIRFPIKEESSRLTTSFPFSKRDNGKEPARVGPMLPPTRAPLLKTDRGYKPCSVFTHANPRASGSVATSGTGRRTDIARRASGDVTDSSPISWMLFP